MIRIRKPEFLSTMLEQLNISSGVSVIGSRTFGGLSEANEVGCSLWPTDRHHERRQESSGWRALDFGCIDAPCLSRPTEGNTIKVQRCKVGADAGVRMLPETALHQQCIAYTRGGAPATAPLSSSTLGDTWPPRLPEPRSGT